MSSLLRLILYSLILLICALTQAIETPLTLDTAEEIAITGDPKIKAIAAEIAAMHKLQSASAELPDPQVRVGLLNFPFENSSFSSEAMTQLSVGLRQTIPPRGQRAASQEIYSKRADEKSYLLTARQNDIRLEVRLAWLESYFQDHAIVRLQESYEHFEDLVDIAQSLYSVGTHNQEDVLLAQVNLLRMDERLIQAEQQREEAYTQLSRLLNTEPNFKIAEGLPKWTIDSSIENLKVLLLNHPETRAIFARSEQHDARQDLVASSRNPSWAIDLGYGLRDGEFSADEPRSDVVSLSVSFSVPMLRNKGRTQRLQSEIFLQTSELENRTLLLRDMEYQLSVAYSRWSSLTDRLNLYNESLNQQIRELATATLTSYQNKNTELAEVIARYIEEIEHLLAVVRLQVERLKIWAKIDWLTAGVL